MGVVAGLRGIESTRSCRTGLPRERCGRSHPARAPRPRTPGWLCRELVSPRSGRGCVMHPARGKKRRRTSHGVFGFLAVACLLASGSPARCQLTAHDTPELGMKALQSGEYARARQIFSDLAKQSPSAENIGYLAMAEAGVGNLAQAIGHFQESIRLGSSSAAIHYNLGIAYLHSGRRQEAIRELGAAIARDPKSLPPRYPLGVALLEEGRPREALPYLEQAQKSSPHEAGIWVNLVRAEFESGNDSAALRNAGQAVAAVIGDLHMFVAIASLCLQHGQARKARFLLEDANTSNSSDAAVALLLARVNLQSGEPRETLAVLENLPPDTRPRGEIMFLKGEAHTLTKEFAAAEANFSAALAAEPQNIRYLIGFAWLQQREGHHQAALSTLRKARELDARTPVIPFRMAVSYFFLGRHAQAVQACEDTIRLDPRYAAAYPLLGGARLQQKNFTGAQAAFQHAVALKPEVALFHLLLGVALYQTMNLAESRKELDQALALDPQSAQAYFCRA